MLGRLIGWLAGVKAGLLEHDVPEVHADFGTED